MAGAFALNQPGSSLPSYEAATSNNPLPILAPYVRREDLYNCSLVCRAWHEAFEDELWGEPAAAFGLGSKNPLGSFILFLKYLPKVPSHTRTKVHTLNLERVTTSIYTSLPPIWFSNLLILLPDLRRLLLPNLSFVDHNSLIAQPSLKGDLPHYFLYHLNISNLTNTTSKSLVALFKNLTPGIAVLDLSRTNSAGHPDVINAISDHLRNLKSLKLKWLKLSNATIKALARGVQVRLERLDVTGNVLTDEITGELLDWCFMPPEFEEAINSTNVRLPVAHESDDDSDDEFGDEEEWMTAKKLRRREMSSQTPILPDIYGNMRAVTKGLTHLHISNNKITSYGIWKLLNSTKLRTMDCGTIINSPGTTERRKAISQAATAVTYYGFRKLTNLRIDHEAVIQTTSSGCQETDLLAITRLPRLKTLALTNVPSSTRDPIFRTSFKQFLANLPETDDRLKTVVLEITESEAPNMGFYELADSATGGDTSTFFDLSKSDFSFFEDEVFREGAGNWREMPGLKKPAAAAAARAVQKREVQTEVSTLDLIREWRISSTMDGRRWKGNIKIMRDIGGSEVSERGVGGNRWGVVAGTA